MAQRIINIGSSANKGDGDPIRTAFGKVNDNFTELYGKVTVLEDGTVAQVQDTKGSIFADDSTLLVDAINGLIPASVVSGTLNNNTVGTHTGPVDGDLVGSVFADNSTLLVDGVAGKIVGPIEPSTIEFANATVNNFTSDKIDKVVSRSTLGVNAQLTDSIVVKPSFSAWQGDQVFDNTNNFRFSPANSGIYRFDITVTFLSKPDFSTGDGIKIFLNEEVTDTISYVFYEGNFEGLVLNVSAVVYLYTGGEYKLSFLQDSGSTVYLVNTGTYVGVEEMRKA